MNFVILYGVIHLSVDLFDRRHKVTADEIEEESLFQEWLDQDEARSQMSVFDARAAFIAWRDTQHYGQ